MGNKSRQPWLLIFYSVPSHPVSNRMKIWRKLAKAGAIQLKGAVYILPATEEHEEFFQWLISEVRAMGGDGAFVRSPDIRTMNDDDVRQLFIRQSEQEYRRLEKALDGLERMVQSIRKGTKARDTSNIADAVAKFAKELEDVGSKDFFGSSHGSMLKKRFALLSAALRSTLQEAMPGPVVVNRRRARDYQGRTWATRKNPFADRMASAWLIRRFIDPAASFAFIEEKEATSTGKNIVGFDMRGAEFTHVGDLCTFEVLVRSFGIRDKGVRRIAEIVHDLDLKDGKYGKPETAGVEEILSGIRKTAKNDADGLERGIAAFEMLYQSKS